jgi:hypothetical protein
MLLAIAVSEGVPEYPRISVLSHGRGGVFPYRFMHKARQTAPWRPSLDYFGWGLPLSPKYKSSLAKRSISIYVATWIAHKLSPVVAGIPRLTRCVSGIVLAPRMRKLNDEDLRDWLVHDLNLWGVEGAVAVESAGLREKSGIGHQPNFINLTTKNRALTQIKVCGNSFNWAPSGAPVDGRPICFRMWLAAVEGSSTSPVFQSRPP